MHFHNGPKLPLGYRCCCFLAYHQSKIISQPPSVLWFRFPPPGPGTYCPASRPAPKPTPNEAPTAPAQAAGARLNASATGTVPRLRYAEIPEPPTKAAAAEYAAKARWKANCACRAVALAEAAAASAWLATPAQYPPCNYGLGKLVFRFRVLEPFLFGEKLLLGVLQIVLGDIRRSLEML